MWRHGALLLAAVFEPVRVLYRGSHGAVNAMREKSKNTVGLGGVSKLVTQFSGAVRGLSTEGTCNGNAIPEKTQSRLAE